MSLFHKKTELSQKNLDSLFNDIIKHSTVTEPAHYAGFKTGDKEIIDFLVNLPHMTENKEKKCPGVEGVIAHLNEIEEKITLIADHLGVKFEKKPATPEGLKLIKSK